MDIEELTKQVNAILGYPEGDILTNVQRYKNFAMHEISLLKTLNDSADRALANVLKEKQDGCS